MLHVRIRGPHVALLGRNERRRPPRQHLSNRTSATEGEPTCIRKLTPLHPNKPPKGKPLAAACRFHTPFYTSVDSTQTTQGTSLRFSPGSNPRAVVLQQLHFPTVLRSQTRHRGSIRAV
jgi:hypothetical protein